MGANEIIGTITVIMGIGLHVPYLRDAITRRIKPHPFTWIIWTLLTAIVFFAQLSDGAGPGAWTNGTVALLCVFIVAASLRNGFHDIKRSDVILFVTGLLTIPLWVLTDDPLYSVITISIIDTIAFLPTFRKSYHKPNEEALYLYGLNFIRHGLSIVALAHYSVVTALFPAVLVFNNLALALFLIWRRRMIARHGA